MTLKFPFAAILVSMCTPAFAADAIATIADSDGNEIGQVELTATASGQVHVSILLEGISPGIHGVHIHETGDCSAADFSSAGGHLSGDRDHGVLAQGGPHPGDLPNAHVGEDGKLHMEAFNAQLNLSESGPSSIFDDDGSAFIVHSGPDDYESQPSGAAGDRIACGVFEPSGS